MAGRDSGSIFAALPETDTAEQFTPLLSAPNLSIERIVSSGQATAPGHWLDQPRAEWILLLEGAAALRFADEDAPRRLQPGDFLLIPAHRRHRVEWTDPTRLTLWLAIHFG